ncbi:small ribosomal subunit protein mS29-like isoform X1 [Asterias amurensis]|uniref:small ribosomal subunit protein mS29-like isoform X1 n=1 Tax=Asterias amurensis TaxID=7602 RepID=UPI003AB114B8
MAAPVKLAKCCASGRTLMRSTRASISTLRRPWLRPLSGSSHVCDAVSTQETTAPPSDIFRTSQDNPANHGVQDVGMYYTIPMDQVKKILPVGYSRSWEKLIVPFQEAAVMVRKPATDIISLLNTSNYSHPPMRYVLYGTKGSGKTMSLCHIIHYCHSQRWLIVHVPCAFSWIATGRFDYIDSVHQEGMYDQPAFSTEWLKQFKARNEHFLPQLKTSESYVWSKRETTEKNEPLLAVIEQGLSRPKNATDAIGVVLKELQLQSFSGGYKMMVAVKGVNAFFSERTIVRKPGGYRIPVREMTMVQHFKKMLLGNWINGAIVTSVDQHLCRPQPFDYKPLNLLHKEGFETMDPFLPVFVDNYSDKEFESCLALYKEKRWLQNEAGKNINQSPVRRVHIHCSLAHFSQTFHKLEKGSLIKHKNLKS